MFWGSSGPLIHSLTAIILFWDKWPNRSKTFSTCKLESVFLSSDFNANPPIVYNDLTKSFLNMVL